MSQKGEPSISIVIPTMGRPILIKTVESLLVTARAKELEIIIVGPIPSESVRNDLHKLLAANPDIRHLPVSFPVGDASEKRNAGYRESHSDIIAFIDDDVYVPPHWPDRVIAAFRSADVGMLSGPSLVPTDISLFARLAGLSLSSKAAGYVAHRYLKSEEQIQRVKWSRTIGCNMIFRRLAFEQIRGFNPHFYPGEEMIAANSVAKNGHMLVFDSEVYVYHYPKQTFRGFWRQIFRYGATRIPLIRAVLDVELPPLVPAVWVMSLFVLSIGALFTRYSLWLLILDLVLYAAVSLWITLLVFVETRRLSDFLLWLAQPFMHVAYGVGIWFEILRPGKDLGDQVGNPTT